MEQARRLLGEGSTSLLREEELRLGPDLAQCCGGVVTLSLERMPATMRAELLARRDAQTREPVPALWVFGAGHVGKAVLRQLDELPLFDITWIDNRPGLLPATHAAHVHTRCVPEPVELVRAAPAGTSFLVLTHDHELDFQLCAAILARGDAAWTGLIGSQSKAARFRSRLRRAGFGAAAIAALHCPVGLTAIRSKLPAAIAGHRGAIAGTGYARGGDGQPATGLRPAMRTLRRGTGIDGTRHGTAFMSVVIPRLRLSGISRRYGDTRANDGIDLTILPGEIHALLGENGSGKSTLSRIICGITRPDAGGIEWDGNAVSFTNAAAARTLGIGMVFQHFALFESLTVAENIALALPRATGEGVAQRIKEVSRRYGLPLDPRQQVAMLSAGERQRVEIVRCLLGEPRLLVLDEPTSVLSPDAIQALFETLRRLAAEGVSILFISHKLDEVRALCDRATVLRAGRVTGEADPRSTDSATLVRMMLGEGSGALPAHATRTGCADVRTAGIQPVRR